jgi:hypothetical protein
MADDTSEAALSLWCKPVGISNNNSGSVLGLSSITNALKHWAIVVEFSNGDPTEIYEAGSNKATGMSEATGLPLKKFKREQWENDPYFDARKLTSLSFSSEKAMAFCEDFNKEKRKYSSTEENCQKFVSDFIGYLGFDAAVILPQNTAQEVAETGWKALLGASSQSLTRISSANVIKDLILSRMGPGVVKELIKKSSAQAIGKISILTDSPVKEWIAEQGKTFFLTAAGEITENVMNACRGAFNPFQLAQIPAEFFTKHLALYLGADKIDAYGYSKLASLLTSAGFGLLATGPIGMAFSIAFWIGAEFVAYFVRDVLERIFGERFTDIFGHSQTEPLVKNIFNWIKTKLAVGMLVGIEWMRKYIQNKTGSLRSNSKLVLTLKRLN